MIVDYIILFIHIACKANRVRAFFTYIIVKKIYLLSKQFNGRN